MSDKNSRSRLVARRGELLVELFLQDLEPTFVSQPTVDVGHDFLVGFQNDHGGTNTFAVRFTATERPVASPFRIPSRSFRRLTYSNIPSLFLVADVKQNRLYYAWLSPGSRVRASGGSVPVPLTELNEATKALLREQLHAAAAATTRAATVG